MRFGSLRTARLDFTLVELLAVMSVLVILVLGVVQMLDNASSVANSVRRALETNDQARKALDYLSQDVGQIVRDVNVDAYFPSAATKDAPSGEMFFYTGRQGYAAASATNGSFAPLAPTTLASNPIVLPASTDTSFHVLSEDVSRLEFCYQLKDGTYSSQPVFYTQSPTWGADTFFHAAMTAPSASNGDPIYEVGSRWYDARLHLHEREREHGIQPSSLAVRWLAGHCRASRHRNDNGPGWPHRGEKRGRDLMSVAQALPTLKNSNLVNPPAVTTQAAQLWVAKINGATLSTIVPQRAVASLRLYQRYVYLDA